MSAVSAGKASLPPTSCCGGSGLSRDSGLTDGSASRGEAFSDREKEAARGEECSWNAAFGREVARGTCERNVEKGGTAI